MFAKNRYPENWKDLATEIKERAGWKCQKCGLQCVRPGEEARGLLKSERTARKLAVHHQNRSPENSEPGNLIAVYPACHLAYHQRGLGNVSPGQLQLC